jgi:translation initiation factor IF-2
MHLLQHRWHTGIPDMLNLLVDLTQRMLGERLGYVDELQCTVLEVKVRAPAHLHVTFVWFY